MIKYIFVNFINFMVVSVLVYDKGNNFVLRVVVKNFKGY